jgi:hypothetical protein
VMGICSGSCRRYVAFCETPHTSGKSQKLTSVRALAEVSTLIRGLERNFFQVPCALLPP